MLARAIVGFSILVWLGCGDEAVSTQKEVPGPEIVPYTAIPQPFTNSMYFLYGFSVEDGPVPVFEELLEADLDVENAWYPEWDNPGPCLVLMVNQLIVRLKAPDERIYDFGFVSDSSQVFVGICIPTWEHYRFED